MNRMAFLCIFASFLNCGMGYLRCTFAFTVVRVTFFTSSVERNHDRSVGDAGIPLEFTDIVVCLVVAAAHGLVSLGTDCNTDAFRFWLIFRVTVLSIGTIDSFTVGSYKSKSTMAEHETRRLRDMFLLRVI